LSAGARIDESLVEAFEQDGVVLLRNVLGSEQIDRLTDGVERNLRDLSPLGMNATKPGEPGAFVEDFRNWQRVSQYAEAICGSALPAVAGALMRSKTVRLFHDHLLVKEAGTLDRSPWHQDQPYYSIDGRQTVSFWIPLDPVPRLSTLEFVAGSHAEARWYMPRSFVKGTPMVFEEGALEEVPDIDADRDAWPIVGWEMQPGDAVAFNMLTPHAAAGSPTRRRAFSLRLIGDDVRWAPRPHRTSPPFDELDGVLEAGAPLEHELFPVLWREDTAGREAHTGFEHSCKHGGFSVSGTHLGTHRTDWPRSQWDTSRRGSL
jgi:ectoine hydroxylase-related dioxygenase (phytanoyl-CoA dioxygenase family)